MKETISDFITQSFTIDRHRDFISCVFSDKKGELELRENELKKIKGNKLKEECCLLPEPIKLGNYNKFEIYAFKVESIHAKRGLYNELKEKLREIKSQAILACFYQEDHPAFRLTLITRSANEKGGIDYSNSKRQSFVLGSGENTRTALENFTKLAQEWKVSPGLKPLTEAFAIEPVTKEFFDKYKELYEKKVSILNSNQAIMNIFSQAFQEDVQKTIPTFVKKLLGRIVFLCFIQKKGWLGVPKDGKWGDGDRKFLKNLFEKHGDEFYQEALAPLFFDSLNRDRGEKAFSEVFKSKIPFLNGGLFEENKIDKNLILNEVLNKDFFKDIFEFFEQYNFTIDESTPLDIEVGIDPEMLGKVFENLIDYNKETGAFYTRRGIVHFMCKNALVLKFTQIFGAEKKEDIENLIYNQESDNAFVRKNGARIKEELEKVKILDPAIGSGAYPMGLLNEIISIYTALNKTMQDSEIASLKRKIIENNIYGIDIDWDAIEIAKLRFWLSIAVDEEIPRPLPNLDFKFMQGNSLLETLDGFEFLPQDLLILKKDALDFNEDNSDFNDIKTLIHQFYNQTDSKKKQSCKKQLRDTIKEILDNQIEDEKTAILIGRKLCTLA